MAKPRLEKVRALFYVLQQLTKRGCANFDTASRCTRTRYELIRPTENKGNKTHGISTSYHHIDLPLFAKNALYFVKSLYLVYTWA